MGLRQKFGPIWAQKASRLDFVHYCWCKMTGNGAQFHWKLKRYFTVKTHIFLMHIIFILFCSHTITVSYKKKNFTSVWYPRYLANLLCYSSGYTCFFILFKRVLDRGPEQRESKMTVLCPLIIIILIGYIIIYYIIIKLLIIENHKSRNRKQNYRLHVLRFQRIGPWFYSFLSPLPDSLEPF